MNYAAYVKAKLDDPNTPRAEHMRYWQEWQDINQRQGHANFLAAERTCRNALRASMVGHAGCVGAAVGVSAA